MADQMEARSTNVVGYTHFQGDVVSGVGDARGWKLGTASSGVALVLEPISDDPTVSVTIRQKGAGTMLLGSTTADGNLALQSDQITLGSAVSTVTIAGVAFDVGVPSSFTSTNFQVNSTRVQIGTSGALVTVGETTLTQLRVGGSTAPFQGFLRVNVANCTTFNFTSTDAGVSGETTVTVTGVNSSHFVTANAVTFPTAVNLVHAYPVASTAASVHLVWVKGSTVAVGNSTANVRFMVTRF